MAERVRIGVIGAGWWATAVYIPQLAKRPDVELAAVSRRSPTELEMVREKFGFRFATRDFRELVEQPLDGVVVTSPHSLHYEHAKAALEHGLHVMVDKPFTLRASEAWELVELSEKMQRVLIVPTGYHYRPMVLAAKKQMEQGAIGSVEYMLCHLGSALRSLYAGTPWPYGMENIPDPKDYYSDPKVSGGGQGYSQLSHSVMLLLWLTGLRAVEVFAYMSAPNARVEMYDALVAKFDNGSIATISGAGTQPPNDPKHELDIRTR